MKLALIALCLFISNQSLAQKCDARTNSGLAACLSGMLKASEGAKVDCAPIQSACEKKVDQLTKDGVVNISFTQGYMDSFGKDEDRNSVLSHYEINSIKSYLTAPCPTTFQNNNVGTAEERKAGCGVSGGFNRACGFKRTDDPEILVNSFVIGGKKVMVKMRLVNSAVTERDNINRNSLTNMRKQKSIPANITDDQLASYCAPGDEHVYQVCRSKYAEKFLEKSISDGDEIVIYNGHARGGGGPEFGPAKTLPNGRVNYPWYRATREGHKLETRALQKAAQKKKAPVFYGSFSCKGQEVFEKNGNFPEASPDTSYILSNRISYSEEAIGGILSSLDGTLNGRCGQELDERVSKVSCAFEVSN